MTIKVAIKAATDVNIADRLNNVRFFVRALILRMGFLPIIAVHSFDDH